MNQHFTHIASVIFDHEYLETELFDGFSIGLSDESKQVLSNLKVLIKPFEGGFNILCEEPELCLGESNAILIQIKLKTPLFYNYTDLGKHVRPNYTVFYFDLPNPTERADTLHHQDFVSDEDALGVLNQRNLEDINSKITVGENWIQDHFGNIISPNELTRYFLQSGEAILTVKEGKSATSYYKVAETLGKPPFAIISINMDTLVLKFQEHGTANPFQIRFKARKTIWKYILSDKVFDKFSRLTVVDLHQNNIQFTEKEFEIQSSRKVRSFESSEAIPYRASSKSRFQLIEKSMDERQAGRVIYKQLPDAKPEQLHHFQNNPDLTYSHIFI